ncbi:MAG: response regulator [bacterium]
MEPTNNDSATKPLVMVANSNQIAAKVIKRYLNNGGYDTIIVHDGLSCLEQLRAIQNQPIRVDCIITSVLMTGIDGYKLIAAVRKDLLLCDIPILVVSAIADKIQEQIKIVKTGGDDYMVMPIEEELLLAKVRNLVKYSQAHAECFRLQNFIKELSGTLHV